MPLTEFTVRNAKARDKAYKLADEKGMYLLVNPTGKKWWRIKYRFNKKEKSLSLGVYPEISLSNARAKRNEARQLLDNDIDPGLQRRIEKSVKHENSSNTFEIVAREWHSKYKAGWSIGHAARTLTRIEQDLFPLLGPRPIAEIKAADMLTALRRIESRGVISTLHRIHQHCGQIMRYAVATGRAERDVAADLRGALKPDIPTHHASITDPKDVGKLLRAIEQYEGFHNTRCALRLAPLVFVRPGELRHAEWSEIDFDTAEWRIPASKMKMRVVHIVPLSQQAVITLREMYAATSHFRYVFPSIRTGDRPMSENTINAALRSLGYAKETMTGHGFRSMASTLLNENGWNRDCIERQLAHAERNNVRAAYNYAEFLPERRKMMQWWAEYLDDLRTNKVLTIKKLDIVPLIKELQK